MRFSTTALALVAAASLACAAPATVLASGDPTDGHVYPLHAQNGSGETGTFALKPHGPNRTTIEVHLVGAPEDVIQPAHIHMGTCAKLDPTPLYPLKSVKDGISETSLNVPIATLMTKGLAVNVHASAADLTKYVSCGDIAPHQRF